MINFAAEYKPRLSELTKITAPIIVEQIFITIMGLVNTVMISSVGVYAVAAAGLIDNISNLIIAVFTALTTGGAIVVARHFGRDDRIGASKAGAQSTILAFALSMFISVIFLVFRSQIMGALLGGSDQEVYSAAIVYFTIIIISYPFLAVTQTLYGAMRGCGDTGAPMVITLIMNVVNIILSYVLIIGINIFGLRTPGFGVKGAAAALTLARLSGLVISVVYIVFRSKVARLNKLSYFKPDMRIWRGVLGLGAPTSLESTIFQAGRLITQLFIVGMGEAAMATNTIASSITGFINVPGNAFALGVMIIVGQRAGRGQVSDIKKTSVFATVMGAVLMGAVCCACIPLIGPLAGVYHLPPEAASMFRPVLLSCLIVTPFIWAPSFIPPASLRAVGDVTFTMAVAIISMWAFRIIFGYFFGIVMGMGVLGVWIAMYVDWLVRAAVYVWRLLSGRWETLLRRAG